MQKTQTKTSVVLQMPVTKQLMKDHIADEVLRHWNSIRRGHLVPKRSDIDPRALQKALNYSFILEQHPTGDLRFRLVGSKVCDCMGMELRGMPAHALIEWQDRARFTSALTRLQTAPDSLDIHLSEGARLILLPLADDQGGITRALGCLFANPDNPAFPTRLYIRSLNAKRVTQAPSEQALELAEAQTQFQPPQFQPRRKKAAPSGPPALRLVIGCLTRFAL